MKIDLEVLASTDIKRKKPWPRIIWIGEEQESLLLLDSTGKRISVLYVPSGKTKRRLPKVSPIADQVLQFSQTQNGRFLLGLLQSGEIFVWYKDKDVVKTVPGLEKIVPNFTSEKCHIAASGDCSHIFLAVGHSVFYLWVMEKGESVVRDKNIALKGSWHKISVPNGMDLPTDEAAECTMSSVFYESPVLGHCCQCSVIYNKVAVLSIATLVLKFPDPLESFGQNLPIFSAEWSLLEYPFQQMHPEYEAISTPGAYVSSYCGNGQVLAVAANQRSPSQTAMLFVSPLTDTVLVGGMRGCGIADVNKMGRQYWVTDLSWTSDNLFVACILNNGSVCLIPRLGEPIVIQTEGYSVNMGPSHFLPLHPAIFVSDNQGSVEPSAAEQDPMQQQFSLATHPSLPIILFSDGFLVTVVQLPVEMTSVTLMRGLVIESAKHLKKLYTQESLDMTVADSYKLSKGQKGSRHPQAEQKKPLRQYEFELAEISLNATHESEVSIIETTNKFGFDQFGAIGNLDSGKIVFGEPEMISIDPNATFSGLEASESLLKYLEASMSSLTLAWKLAASYSDIWTSEVDNITKQAVHNLSKIFSVVLDCPAVETIIPILTPRQSSAIQNPRVYNIIVTYRNVLQLLRFDTFNQHLIPAALRLVHKTIILMLTSQELENTDPKLKTLFGCYSLLKHAETSLNRVYVWVPSHSEAGTPTGDGSPRRFEPAVMTKLEKQTSGSASNTDGVHLDQKGQLPGKRLAATWKLLYKHVIDYQSQVSKKGDSQEELSHLEKLMFSIQQTLQETDTEITPRRASAKVSTGDKLSVDGEHTLAVNAWKDQLREVKKDNPKIAKMLHSVLYTYLLKDNLSDAVDFIDSIVLQARVDSAVSTQELPTFGDGNYPPLMTLVTHRSQDSEEEELVPCIKNKSIRQTVQTMARFMAAYFSNETMFIFPPHSAQALPSVHMSSVPTKSRIIPKYHEDITNVITRENLSGMWTTERTVEYLLLSGLICETAWFAYKMGDWKTAFLLSVAHTGHREIAQHLYQKPKKHLQLPHSLVPYMILQEKLTVLIKSNTADRTTAGSSKDVKRYFIPINQETNIPQLTRTLEDIMTAGIICDVEVAPWLLSNLTEKLKSVVSNLPSLVPQDFYLPAPPLFCPQPGEIEMGLDQPDVQYEKELRMEMSSIIQLILVSLNSAHLSLLVARWYIQELFKIQERAAQFKATTEGPCLELPEILQQYKIVRSDIVDIKDDPNVQSVMSSFRDICTILWLLHVRDELSLHLRKRGKQLSNDTKDGKESPTSTLGQEYVQECFKILKWAVHMLSFTSYVADDGCIRKVILSLILELPATEDTADILAEHFYAAENYDAEVQEKLERLLSVWQSVEILPEDDGKSARVEESEEMKKSSTENDDEDEDDGSVRKSVTFYQASPRAKTLSVYYHKQCEVVQKVLKKRRKCFGQYDELVFNSDVDNDNTLPSAMSSAPPGIYVGSRPFETKQSFLEFLDRFYAICFTKVVQKESEGGKSRTHAILMPFSSIIRETKLDSFISKNAETYQKKHSSVVLASPRAKFIRSQSESHVNDSYSPSSPQKRSLFRSNSSGDVQQSRSPTGMSRFDSDGSLLVRNSPGRNRPPMSSSRKPNMTGMASRFFQSEEVLYRDPAESQEAHWILDVNFGQRYLALQQLLDYLHDWGSKTHSLGLHGKSDKDLGMKPTMRIEVPTQLVVLGLWLLEHKYSSSKMRQLGKAAEQTVEGSIEAEIAENQLTNAKARALATVEELTEHDSFTQVSNIPRSRSHSPKGQRSRSHSPGGDLVMSKSAGFNVSKDKTLDSFQTFTTSQEETEQMKSAYKKVLDGGDDSSSLEVSSLEPDDYGDELKKSLSAIESEGVGRSRSPKRRRSPRRLHASPDGRNNSALNNTLQFAASPERGNNSYQAPQTSTPVKGGSPSRRQKRPEDVQADISRISLPPRGGIHGNTAPPGGQPQYYRGGLLGGNPSHTTPPAGEDIFSQQVAGNPQNMAGMDLAQQLQHIVRGELRRMMEVQHHSMMAMMGALDGQELPAVAWQQGNSANQRQAHPSSRSMSPPRGGHPGVLNEYQPKSPRGKKSMRGVLNELKNLQIEDENQHRHKKSKSPSGTLRQGKENFVDSPLRMSALDRQENIEVYRISREDGDPNNVNFVPKFLRVPAERDDSGVRFPHIPFQAWSSREGLGQKQDIPDMPLLHVERTVPASVFPEGQRSHSLPKYLPQHGYFQPPPTGMGQAPAMPIPSRQLDSPDSGIGIPLLRIPMDNEPVRRQPRFGELLPPDVVIETAKERQEKEKLREKYLREYHKLQAENSEATEKQRFGENLLHLSLKSEGSEEEQSLGRKKKVHSPHKSPRKSPRKTPRSVSEQLSARKEKSVRKSPGRPKTPESVRRAKTSDEGEEIKSSERQPSKMEDSGEEAESEDEDATEAESVEEEEELDDGYAIRPGEFEAYLALEKQLAKTKDTNARIQLKTALRLQQQRMKENWKRPRRPKVDFATNTAEMMEAGTDADFADMEADNIRTSEKATSITKDTGVDPIHEAVIEYNKSRQPNMLPPDIYMGLRFSEAGHQPGSDVTGQPQGSRGRNYLNVVDLDASAILKDLKERPESEEPQLDVSVPATQQHIRNRIAMEERERSDLEPPVTERPTRADALTVRLFDTKYQGQERVSIAVMPREGMPDSKYAVMQRLRDMNTQLAAIDRMSNNMEKEFKNTRLAIHTLDQMTEAMEPPTREDIEMEDQYVPEKLERSTRTSRSGSPGDGRTLTPQPSAKSPTLSARATARSTARSTTRSKKSTVGDVRQMSTELAKVSGLSGISDIIGDMVAKGDINLDDVGLTKKEADHLVQRGAIRHEEVSQARISLDEIKKMASAAKHGGYDKDELHTWMAGKRQRQMEEYKRQVEELREKETRPFRPKDENLDVSFTTKERNALAEARKDSRKANARAFMTQRLDEAQSLLGNILTDKPELPKELPARPTHKRKPSVDRSPVRGRDAIKPKTFKKDTSPISVRKPQGILKNRDARSPAVPDYPQYEDEPYMDGYDSYDLQESWMDESLPRYEPPTPQTAPRQIMVQPTKEPRRVEVSPVRTPGKKVPGVVPKLKLGLDDVEEEPRLQQTAETTGELSEYYRAVEAMDVYDSQERSKEVARQLSEKEAEPTPQKTYKAKSYKDLVKVQRPEVTRKKANKFGLNYVGRLQSVSQSETSRTSARTQPTQREMEMIQGSKRLPMKKPTETTPRRVKTYTERLQEMKTKEKYSTPVAPRSQYGSSIASPSARSTRPTTRSMKPKHKPMTYVEQLKKINEGHHKPRMGATTIIQKPMVKSHKPPHKPKTYAEQLQELQPTKTIQGPPSKRMHRPAPSRQRPYRDPYAVLAPEDFDRLETDSVVSGWSMGDDVRQILYDDVEGSIAVGQSASYAPSEQISDYFNDVMGDSYTASVDIDDLVQIADAGSVSSGSMMSFIDWDQVDDLIADVK